MKKLVVKQINPAKGQNIDTAANQFISKNNLAPEDISSIFFNSDLSKAIIIFHAIEVAPEAEELVN